MRIKVVSDAHANYPALKQATELEDNEDFRVFLGDIVGLMGYPSETVDYIRKNYDVVLKGNHDVVVLEKGEGHVNSKKLSEFEHDYTNAGLSDEQKSWVTNRTSLVEHTFKLGDEEVNVVMAHAKPKRSSEKDKNMSAGVKKLSMGDKVAGRMSMSSASREYDYVSLRGIDKHQYKEVTENVPSSTDYVFLGHIHQQFNVVDEDEDITLVNPGSIGQGQNTYSIVDTSSAVEERQIDFNEQKNLSDKLKSLNRVNADSIIS